MRLIAILLKSRIHRQCAGIRHIGCGRGRSTPRRTAEKFGVWICLGGVTGIDGEESGTIGYRGLDAAVVSKTLLAAAKGAASDMYAVGLLFMDGGAALGNAVGI